MGNIATPLPHLLNHQQEIEYQILCFKALLLETEKELQQFQEDGSTDAEHRFTDSLAGTMLDFAADVYDLYQYPQEISKQTASPTEIQDHCRRLRYHCVWLKELLRKSEREVELVQQEIQEMTQ
jgi:hypothetical protein